MTLLHRHGLKPYADVSSALAFHFLTPDATAEMQGVLLGTPPLSEARSSTIFARDYQGAYQEFAASEPAWVGGRVTGTVGSRVVYATDGGDTPLSEMPYILSAPESTNVIHYSDGEIGDKYSSTGGTPHPVNAAGIFTVRGFANAALFPSGLTASQRTYFGTQWDAPPADAVCTITLLIRRGDDAEPMVQFIDSEVVGECDCRILVDSAALATELLSSTKTDLGSGQWEYTITYTNPGVGFCGVFRHVDMRDSDLYSSITQIEQNGSVTPYIPTNGSSVTRDACALSFNSTNWSDTEGSVYLEADVSGTATLVDGLLDIASGFIGLTDGTKVVRAASLVEGACQVGWVYGPAGMRLCVDGTWTQTVPYDGGMLQGIFDLFRSASVVGVMRDIQASAEVSEQWITGKMPTQPNYGDDFVMVVETATSGETFTLPCGNAGVYNAAIDWGDGTPTSPITSYNDPNLAHTYATVGKHTIRVSGTLPWISFSNGGDKAKVIAVLNGGSIGSLSAYQMFYGCSNLVVADMSDFDTAAVTNMSSMFHDSPNLITLDLSSFDTAAVTSMASMFRNCSGLTTLDVSGFDTAAVTNMSLMFRDCSGLTALDLFSFDTAAVTNMSSMFYGSPNLITLDLSSFDTAVVSNMSLMFRNCSSLTTLDVSSFDTAALTTTVLMFANCPNVTSDSMDGFLSALYASRMATTWETPEVDISPCNAPSGVYQDATPPTTGEEYRYKLENDPDTEGFNTWTITV